MIKAHLPPEKSVYSLPRAAPGSPKPSRPYIPVRRPAACPYPPPKPPPKPGDFTRFKTSRPGQGTLPGTNIDRE